MPSAFESDDAFGHTVPTGRGTEVVVVAPIHCGNGHRLRGNVSVKWARCDCGRVRPGTGGHHYWICLVNGCGDERWGDSHVDHAQLVT